MATGVFAVTLLLLAGVGALACRIQPQSRPFRWLVWTYVWIAFYMAGLSANAIQFRSHSWEHGAFESRPFETALILLTPLVSALLWPVLVLAAGFPFSFPRINPFFLALQLVAWALVAVALFAAIRFAIHGLLRRSPPSPRADEPARRR